MTEGQFCDIFNAFHGDDIEKPEQLPYLRVSGSDLFEFVKFAVQKIEMSDMIKESRKQTELLNEILDSIKNHK